MNKILLSFLAGISLFSVSAFAMDGEDPTVQHPSVKQRIEEEPFNFLGLPPEDQNYILLSIFDQRDLFHMTSTCTLLREKGEDEFDDIWLQNRLLSVMPAVLPTTHGPNEVFLTMKWGLCSENKEYLMWGKLLKVILKDVDDDNATDGVFKNTFEIQGPDYDENLHDPDDSNSNEGCTMFRIMKRQNLNDYHKIRDSELFTAVALKPRVDTNQLCKWNIQGAYPSGEKFSLNILNCEINSDSEEYDSD